MGFGSPFISFSNVEISEYLASATEGGIQANNGESATTRLGDYQDTHSLRGKWNPNGKASGCE